MRYKLTVEYDGTSFSGWQRQKNADSIEERLEKAIIPISKIPVVIHGAGRTDAGVHALNQVAHFDLDKDVDCFKIQECMNFYLFNVPISVLKVEKVSNDFDARFSALERSYLYKILNRKAKPSIDLNRVWWVIKTLNIEKMQTAAKILIGKHDFSSFRAAGCQASSPIKTMNSIRISRQDEIIFFEFYAKSFLYHQVRNIVGSLFMVGAERWSVEHFIEVFKARDRTLAGATAPASGLYFSNIKY